MPRAILVGVLIALSAFGGGMLVAVSTAPQAATASGPPTVGDLTDELMCQCGCGMTLAACFESMECTVSGSMAAEIQQQIDQGKTKAEISDYFVAQYGEAVLASPRKSGFGLAAWTMPFLAIVAGGGATAWFVWLWARRRGPRGHQAKVAVQDADMLRRYADQVDEDLKALE